MIKKLIFILFLLLVRCSDDEEKPEILYSFPSLSQGQLIDLKKQSEKIEGFFVTTNLSDLDSSWAERGFYIYVCIRFLNDQTVNDKLKKSAIPLLVQVSNHKDKPEAESLLLFHPQTVKSEKNGIFYYEERQFFEFIDSPMIIRDTEYNIFDMMFNEKNKITELSFIKKGIRSEDLNRFVSDDDTSEDEEEATDDDDDEGEGGGGNDGEGVGGDESEEEYYSSNENDDNNDENDAEYSDGKKSEKGITLGITAFARQFSSSCEDWAILNYNHLKTLPDYLKVSYGSGDSSGDSNGGNQPVPRGIPTNNNGVTASPPPTQAGSSGDDSGTGAIPSPTLIPEAAPYTPLPQTPLDN